MFEFYQSQNLVSQYLKLIYHRGGKILDMELKLKEEGGSAELRGRTVWEQSCTCPVPTP